MLPMMWMMHKNLIEKLIDDIKGMVHVSLPCAHGLCFLLAIGQKQGHLKIHAGG